jgi:hypothetical protein
MVAPSGCRTACMIVADHSAIRPGRLRANFLQRGPASHGVPHGRALWGCRAVTDAQIHGFAHPLISPTSVETSIARR